MPRLWQAVLGCKGDPDRVSGVFQDLRGSRHGGQDGIRSKVAITIVASS